ncbi:hypothetical protein [Yoonia sp. BS5-3]|uniref:Lipopolysaccharide biosynthesis protein n=1 Tax=Yoonia phaeophyticola TaxID=3137369 RepID=A0ABZ2V3M2_9RHOB
MGTLALRGGIVGLNFVIMIGLAAYLGLDAFGALAVAWGLALVAGTVLSLGGPLMLLRHLTDGGGLSSQVVILQVMVLPFLLAAIAYPLLEAVFPGSPWLAILLAGLGINLVTCLASIMRALGSLQLSMALRDAGPQLALGQAVVFGAHTGDMVLIYTLFWLGLFAALAGFWCVRHPRFNSLIKPRGKAADIAWSLWGTAVLGTGLAQVDIIAAAHLLSPEEVGLYALLRRLANLVALPVSVATWVSAAPVSAAFGARDIRQLQHASAKGSQIAFLPSLILFAAGCAVLPLSSWILEDAAGVLALILLIGALVQAIFASSYTVATLCAQAHWAAGARLLSIGLYLILAFHLGASAIGPIQNALLYVGAISAGSLGLWVVIWWQMGVDTSVMVLMREKGAVWRLS